jgi:uroporphyrinogen-III synthase
MGRIPVVAPLLEIRPTPVRLPAPERVAAILLPSGSAIDPLPATYRTRPVLTVGDATALRATQAGFAHVTSAGGDAASLLALVRRLIQPREGTLLLTCGKGQSLPLATDLRAAGYRVARRVVYASVPVARLPEAAVAALNDGQTGTVLFFSAETARTFMRLVRKAGLAGTLQTRDAVTIGPRVRMALEGVPWAHVRVAGRPTQEDMLALLR